MKIRALLPARLCSRAGNPKLPQASWGAPSLRFIAKKRGGYWGGNSAGIGLWHSIQFILVMLARLGFHAETVEVTDANDIDREVTRIRPTHVIVEVFWVVPGKVAELKRLHPWVTWIVRDHSETTFLAHEGIGFEWARLSRGRHRSDVQLATRPGRYADARRGSRGRA
jgi:hypothetical protein